MNMRDIIIAKRDKQSLTDEQIKFFVAGVTDGRLPDIGSSDGDSLKRHGRA